MRRVQTSQSKQECVCVCVSSNLCKLQRTVSVICIQSAHGRRKQPAKKDTIRMYRPTWAPNAWKYLGDFGITNINEESKNSKSCWIIHGCCHVWVDGLHVYNVHLDIKSTETLRGICTAPVRCSGWFGQCRAVYWPYCTSIGYLRVHTVCSEPLLDGPPQWKCSWMVWYTSGRPPPLTDMPLPNSSTTESKQKHLTTGKRKTQKTDALRVVCAACSPECPSFLSVQ